MAPRFSASPSRKDSISPAASAAWPSTSENPRRSTKLAYSSAAPKTDDGGLVAGLHDLAGRGALPEVPGAVLVGVGERRPRRPVEDALHLPRGAGERALGQAGEPPDLGDVEGHGLNPRTRGARSRRSPWQKGAGLLPAYVERVSSGAPVQRVHASLRARARRAHGLSCSA